jgi:MFS family permease
MTIAEEQRKWWILAAMSGVLGLVVLDETVVGVALATIRPDLQMSAKAAHWVVNAYFLTFTCFVAVGGRLADSLGRRGFFVLGVAVFGVSSAVAGFAQDGDWLIAARSV